MNILKYIHTRLLPKTGQIQSIMNHDDGYHQQGWWKNRTVANNKVRFKDNGNSTITDFATGLMWQKLSPLNLYEWDSAIAYAENLTLGGYTNWHLPNIFELFSIVNLAASIPATYTDFFSNITSDLYWSTTTNYYYDINGRYMVDFDNGYVYGAEPDYPHGVICCRII